jgi:hypothetical protein
VEHRLELDDYLPCNVHKQFAGAGRRFTNGSRVWVTCSTAFATPVKGELWVPLLEKAWAKIHGSYSSTIAGHPNKALTDLTGAPCSCYFTTSKSAEELWDILQDAQSQQFVCCASAKDDSEISSGVAQGLTLRHAYTVLGSRTLSKAHGGVRLIRLRNPHGKHSWRGDWGVGSAKWTNADRDPELSEALGELGGSEQKSEDNGNFFMPVHDFKTIFHTLHVLHCQDDAHYEFLPMSVGTDGTPVQAFMVVGKDLPGADGQALDDDDAVFGFQNPVNRLVAAVASSNDSRLQVVSNDEHPRHKHQRSGRGRRRVVVSLKQRSGRIVAEEHKDKPDGDPSYRYLGLYLSVLDARSGRVVGSCESSKRDMHLPLDLPARGSYRIVVHASKARSCDPHVNGRAVILSVYAETEVHLDAWDGQRKVKPRWGGLMLEEDPVLGRAVASKLLGTGRPMRIVGGAVEWYEAQTPVRGDSVAATGAVMQHIERPYHGGLIGVKNVSNATHEFSFGLDSHARNCRLRGYWLDKKAVASVVGRGESVRIVLPPGRAAVLGYEQEFSDQGSTYSFEHKCHKTG